MPNPALSKFDLIQIDPDMDCVFAGCLMVVLNTNSSEGVFGYFEAPFLIEHPDKPTEWYNGPVYMNDVAFVVKNGRPRAYWLVPHGHYQKVGALDSAPEEEFNNHEHGIGFTANRLGQLPVVKVGDRVECRSCGRDHMLRTPSKADVINMSQRVDAYQCGNEMLTPEEGILVYSCDGDVKLGALVDPGGQYRRVAGVAPSMSS